MGTTLFYDDKGMLSSTRTTTKNGMSLTQYVGNTKRGGMTIKSGGITSRLNSSGQSIGSAFKNGSRTTYFDSTGGLRKQLSSFS